MDRAGSGWRALVNAAMNLRGFIKCAEFLDWLKAGSLRKDCAARSDYYYY